MRPVENHDALANKSTQRLHHHAGIAINHIQQHMRGIMGRVVAAHPVEQGGYPEAKAGGKLCSDGPGASAQCR
jgi:hypothetical protein